MTLYLLDANVLITAHNTYYPTDRIPEFWSWTLHHAEKGNVKMPSQIFDEVKGGTGDPQKDLLFAWLQKPDVKASLILGEEVDPAAVAHVVENGYANDLTETEYEVIGQDAFLIAYALTDRARCIVSSERSAPSKKRMNRKVPDVCNDFGVRVCTPFAFYQALDFRTAWNPAP